MESSSIALAGILKWIAGIVPSAIGSALSLKFSGCRGSILEILIMFVAGLCLSYYLGGATIEYFNIQHPSFVADAVKLTWGLFGMGVVNQLYIQIPEIFSALRRKFAGS